MSCSPLFFFFIKYSEDIRPFRWATDTPVLDFWWHLLWVPMSAWISIFMLSGLCNPQIHLLIVKRLEWYLSAFNPYTYRRVHKHWHEPRTICVSSTGLYPHIPLRLGIYFPLFLHFHPVTFLVILFLQRLARYVKKVQRSLGQWPGGGINATRIWTTGTISYERKKKTKNK